VAPGARSTPARMGDPELLLELAAGLRNALLERGERLPASWPDEIVADLRSGTIEGLLLHVPGLAPALGVLSLRPHRAFGQVHVGEGPDPRASAEAAILGLVEQLPPRLERLDVGVTGLAPEEEEALAAALTTRPGFALVRRLGLARALSHEDPPAEPPLPVGGRFRAVRERTIEELGRVDWNAFRAGSDAAFISDTVEGDTQLLQGILAGQLGRFLDEASTVLEVEDQVAGFVLVVEENPMVGVIVDVAVDPALRRQGAGRALLSRALRALVALGYTEARLWVTEANAPARALYEQLGFGWTTTAFLYSWRAPGVAPAGVSPH
jgi:ribosomal protein S18 acetylase RimI-like enzyme